MPPLKKGAEVEIQIESLAYGAEGVGRVDGYVVFVERGLPGQRVKARILRAKKSHTRAKILQVLQQSPDYVPPICRHFPDCGGCSIQHLQYDKQLEAKTTQVRDILQRLGGFENPPVAPALPSPKPFFYRNKMEFTFGDRRWLTRNEIESQAEITNTDFALGLHARHHFEKVIAIEQCYLQSEQSNAILNRVSKFVAASPLRPYTTRDHSGFWRFLVIREGKNTGDCMVNLVTADAGSTGEEEVQKLATELRLHFPELTTIVHTINRLKAQVAAGQQSRVLHGQGFIHEHIGEFRFRISPESFFQTNTQGAEVLLQTIKEVATLQGHEIMYDLYCGAGTIALWLSEGVRKVVGIEVIPAAIRDAKINAELNHVQNCEFIVGDIKDQLARAPELFQKHGSPQVIILDPPRAGLHPKVVQHVIHTAVPKIIYVSCNPSTFARDARMFCEAGYHLQKVQPIDMFPHTAHIESVSLLTK